LPEVDGRFPARLPRHSAFHTPLLAPISKLAEKLLAVDQFVSPELPLIDGRGEIWQPGSDPAALRDYTLGHQVQQTYDFTRAITVGVREFAPERIIVLGPGPAMGAPVLQTLMALEYRGLATRQSWQQRQQTDPLVLAMGIDAQRARVSAA
jgi:acyl transferase domain-containing protein